MTCKAHENDEVESDHIPRMMNLWELDFLFDSLLKLPPPNAPLQRPPNRIGDQQLALAIGRGIVFLFQPIEQGKGS